MDYKVEKTPHRVDVLWEGNTLKEEEIVLFLNRFSPYRRGEEETMEEYLRTLPTLSPVTAPPTVPSSSSPSLPSST